MCVCVREGLGFTDNGESDGNAKLYGKWRKSLGFMWLT